MLRSVGGMAAVLACSLGLGVAAVGGAAAATCSAAQAGGITITTANAAVTDCQSSPAGDNNVDAGEISTMFGAEYQEVGKYEYDENKFTGSGFTITGDEQDGTFSINGSVFDAFNPIVLVIKGSAEYVAYQISLSVYPATDVEGDYESVIFKTKKDGSTIVQDISYISIYGTPSAIPLPAALPLFGTALAGMGLLSWRRRRAQAVAAQ